MHAPRVKHLDTLFCVLRYLKCTDGLGLFFPVHNDSVFRGFCDSDWGGCTISCRSFTGVCLKLGSPLIYWQAKKHIATSKSTTMEEYRALASITTDIMWLKYFLSDLHVEVINVVPIFYDNQTAVKIANNPV